MNALRYMQAMKLRTLVRQFFVSRGYVECETPILVATPGMEPNLFPFEAELIEWNGTKHQAGLITSPEFSLKKILGPEMPKIFEIARVFRNHEPLDASHNPEFTMLEWYQVGLSYEGLMREAEELVQACARGLGVGTIKVGGREVDLLAPWEKISVAEACQKYCGFDLTRALDRESLQCEAERLGLTVLPTDSFDDIFFRLFLTFVEPHLGAPRPTILYDYPLRMAALARKKPSDPRFAERFEIYIGNLELANAYGELTDPVEQRARFVNDQKERHALGKTVFPLDEKLLAELPKIGQASGIALGIDRLAMILCGAHDINDVLAFGAKEMFGGESSK